MAPKRGIRSEAAKRLSDNIEAPDDFSPGEVGEDFYDDDIATTESAINSKTFNVSSDDVNGVRGLYKAFAKKPDEQQKKETEE